MRLLNKDSTPIGGYYFDDPILGRRVFTQGGFNDLIKMVVGLRDANDLPIIDPQEIEDQICDRQPPGRCRMGLGDKIAVTIHGVARVVDKAIGTQLEQKAKTCVSCGKRRERLNSISR